jgi:hypothetical protein
MPIQDLRPDPKPRKNAELWQAYITREELAYNINVHSNRRDSIAAGKTKMNPTFEDQVIKYYEEQLKLTTERMIALGQAVGPIWDWFQDLGAGFGAGTLAAMLLAQIDDIAMFPMVSSL